MKKALKFLAVSAVVIAALYVLAVAFSYGIAKQEVVNCHKLQRQAKDFADAGFYITAWQKGMCDSHGMSINAPVR